jgi:hypothetical protein
MAVAELSGVHYVFYSEIAIQSTQHMVIGAIDTKVNTGAPRLREQGSKLLVEGSGATVSIPPDF